MSRGSGSRGFGPRTSSATWIVPLIGTKRRDRLAEALGALELRLSPDELAALEVVVPPGQVAGDRYEATQMAALDSEKP